MADLPTVDLADFGLSVDLADFNMDKPKDNSLRARFTRAREAPVRTPFQRFKDEVLAGALNAPFGAEGVARAALKIQGVSDKEVSRRERAKLKDIEFRRAHDERAFEKEGKFSPANVGKTAVDLVGNVIGNVDPSYVISPGKTAFQRIMAQGGINAGQDAINQLIQKMRGVRDEYDPYQTGVNAVAGGVFQGAGEATGRIQLGRDIREGMKMPDWKKVNDVIVGHLEGGGTLANPKVSPKGAMGPQQVMPGTARDPGFGIRPWDGKTQADLARVGRQYSAAMMKRYNGDTAKVFAAYNAGPGRVDAAVKHFGGDWLRHMPEETRDYVDKGLDKIGGKTAPEKLGESDLVRGEQPSVSAQADVNNRLSPADELIDLSSRSEDDLRELGIRADNDPEHIKAFDAFKKGIISEDEYAKAYGKILDRHIAGETSNVADISLARKAKDYVAASNLIDRIYDRAYSRWSDVINNERPLSPELIDMAEETRSKINSELTSYEPGTPEHDKLLDIDDLYREMIAHSGGKPRGYAPDASEKFVGGEPRTDAANLNDDRFVGELPKEGYAQAVRTPDGKVHVGTAAEGEKGYVKHDGTFLTESEAHRQADFEAFAHGIEVNRDPNPPAQSSTFGTRRTRDGIDRTPPRRAAEGHDEPRPEDRRSLKQNKKLVLDKLGDALDQTTPLRREAEAMISKERSRRLAAAYKARGSANGREGLYKALAAMKGEIERPKLESIKHWFTEAEIDGMHDLVWNSDKLQGYEHVRAGKALDRLLGEQYGVIPTIKEIELLAKAMPMKSSIWRKLAENQEGTLNLEPEGWKKVAINVASLPRTLKTSFDLSAPGRQGMFLIGRPEWRKNLATQLKALKSEKDFHAIQEEIRSRDTYDLMNKSGLQITRNDGGLGDREEAFISEFNELIPGVRQSERAYMAFLNKLRADVFDSFVAKGERLGIDFVQDPEYLKSAARFINAATGRGSIPVMAKNASLLSNVFFSPKLMASRIQLLNPFFYTGLHKNVRGEAAKQGLIYASVVSSILGLAAMAGAEVNADPRSSDFAKIKVGNTRFDVTGGFQPYVRFYAQFLSGQQKDIKNGKVRNIGWAPDFIRQILPGEDQGKYKPTTRKDILYRFFENKESPNMSEITRLMQGSDPVGNPLTLEGELKNVFMPLIVQDTWDAYNDLGLAGGIAAGVTGGVGVGVQTYKPKEEDTRPEVDLSDFGSVGSVDLKDFQ